MKKKSKLFKNIVSSFGAQITVIILGLVIPKIIITYYGSDANGLISTITQLFTYMALLEAGIGQAAKNLLYKPVSEGDKHSINNVISASSHSFKKMTLFYGMGVIVLSFVAPILLKTNIDRLTVFLIILFEGLSGIISFYFLQTTIVFLTVDGKGYVTNLIELISKTFIYLCKIILALIGINIALLQAASLIITILKVVAYHIYILRKYPWANFAIKKTNVQLKDRNSYVLTEIAGVIFSSTDMIVLSIFYSTAISSVYSVYNMVFSQFTVLFNAVFVSVAYTLGRAFYAGTREYTLVHDAFTSIFLSIITACMCVCLFLTEPFVRIYTKGVNDINYVYSSLPVMFGLVQILSWSRTVPGHLTGLAGYAKQTGIVSLVEALINASLSILLVGKYAIEGVLLATVVSLPLKVAWCLYVSDGLVLRRKYTKSLSILGINYLVYGVTYFISRIVHLRINHFLSFAVYGVFLTAFFGLFLLFLNVLVNRECYTFLRDSLKKRRSY